jgi:predicted glycoside hydrolase/deacetylase ChbG (UPF0249 family)
MKSIVICADDYGLSPAIGAAIRSLAALGRISAVSCMSNTQLWPDEAKRLQPFANNLDVGLHFNLTHGFEKPFKSLGTWVCGSLLGSLSRQFITDELDKQIDLFEAVWERPPDFIDSHQHLHIFPVIRDAVTTCLSRRYSPKEAPWLRDVNPAMQGHDAFFKAIVLKALSTGFHASVARSGYRLSGRLHGLYSLSQHADFPTLVAGWLSDAQSGDLLMCHPALVDDDNEGIGPSRVNEYAFLCSQQFARICDSEHIRIVRCL